jgi:hypothetical protein
MRGYERHEFFNFPSEQPSLKREQMLPFYAFVGKLCTFLESVAARRHYNLDKAGTICRMSKPPRKGLARPMKSRLK